MPMEPSSLALSTTQTVRPNPGGCRSSEARQARSSSRPPVELTITISSTPGESTWRQRTMGARMAAPHVSAIVVNYQRPLLTRACLLALRDALTRLDAPSEIVLVDNGSHDESIEVTRQAVPEATVVELPENRGFPAGASAGIRRSRGEWVALINNDVVVEPGAVAEMLAAGER